MNKSIIFACGLMMSLTACEMKDELWKGSKDSNDKGSLALDVTANAPEALTRAAVNTDNFPVEIAGKGDVAAITYSYNRPADMPASLQLPVGTYTVTAHTPGELERKMDAPYYLGVSDVDILNGVTSRHTLACTMANSRVRVIISDGFAGVFKSWDITINDGTDQVLAYNEASDYADIFWYFKNLTKTITVDIRAVTQDGNSIYATNTYSKAACNEGYINVENEYFTGGDAITITFSPAMSTTGDIEGIGVTANVTFTNEDETVTVTVKDQGTDDDPATGGGDEPTDPSDPSDPGVDNGDITDGPIKVHFVGGNTKEYTGGEFPTVEVNFTFEAGLKSLVVSIDSENAGFMAACVDLGLDKGMDLTDDGAAGLAELFTLPEKNASAYTFSMSDTIWTLLAGYGEGEHKFILKATDNNGYSVEGVLQINVR